MLLESKVSRSIRIFPFLSVCLSCGFPIREKVFTLERLFSHGSPRGEKVCPVIGKRVAVIFSDRATHLHGQNISLRPTRSNFLFFSERSASFSFFIVPDDDEDEKKDGRNLGRAELDEWGLGKGTSYRSQRQCTITQTLRGAKCPKNCDKWFRYI